MRLLLALPFLLAAGLAAAKMSETSLKSTEDEVVSSLNVIGHSAGKEKRSFWSNGASSPNESSEAFCRPGQSCCTLGKAGEPDEELIKVSFCTSYDDCGRYPQGDEGPDKFCRQRGEAARTNITDTSYGAGFCKGFICCAGSKGQHEHVAECMDADTCFRLYPHAQGTHESHCLKRAEENSRGAKPFCATGQICCQASSTSSDSKSMKFCGTKASCVKVSGQKIDDDECRGEKQA